MAMADGELMLQLLQEFRDFRLETRSSFQRLERRLDALEGRLGLLDQRVGSLELLFNSLDHRVGSLEVMVTHLHWTTTRGA
jgi:hypothetical protein